MVAHGYAFLNFQPSHDALKEAVSDSMYWIWKIQLGRYLKVLYDHVFGSFTSFPWTNGLMALVWISLSAYFIVLILKIQKPIYVAITCGFLTTNLTMLSLTASYMPDLASDMCALFFAVL